MEERERPYGEKPPDPILTPSGRPVLGSLRRTAARRYGSVRDAVHPLNGGLSTIDESSSSMMDASICPSCRKLLKRARLSTEEVPERLTCRCEDSLYAIPRPQVQQLLERDRGGFTSRDSHGSNDTANQRSMATHLPERMHNASPFHSMWSPSVSFFDSAEWLLERDQPVMSIEQPISGTALHSSSALTVFECIDNSQIPKATSRSHMP